MGARTGTFCKDDEDSEKKSHRYLTLFRMLFTDWPGKISGISCKRDCCDGCVMFQLCRSGLFLRLSGRMPMAIWESWTASSIWARMISSLITFSIQKRMSLLNRWAPSRKIVLCSSQWWCRCNLSGTIYWSAPFYNLGFCSCRHAYLMGVMVACH